MFAVGGESPEVGEMTYILEFRSWNTGGPVVPGQLRDQNSGAQGEAAKIKLALEPEITFLLHGYNVDRPTGLAGLTNLATFVKSAISGAVVAVLWPGDSFAGFLSYPFEGDEADDTAAEFAQFITDVLPSSTPLSFVTHSLGARVGMETVDALLGTRHSVKQVCLMAPAIDDFSLASSEDYRAAVASADRVAVLSSTQDNVLKYAYPAGDLLQSFLFFWREDFGFALGYRGPNTFEDSGAIESIPHNVIHWPINTGRGADHGHYIPDFQVDQAPATQEQKNRESAARYAGEVIAGLSNPQYL